MNDNPEETNTTTTTTTTNVSINNNNDKNTKNDHPPPEEEDKQKIEWTWKKLGQYIRQKNGSNNVDDFIDLLKKVHKLEHQYIHYVQEENSTVSRCQTMEKMALEALQELEEVSNLIHIPTHNTIHFIIHL